MSSSPHHIPFPRNFLSLNTPLKKSTDASSGATTSPESERSAHSFLSNRPVTVPRHSSISSVSSVGSATSEAPTVTTSQLAASPVLQPAITAFLALNTKYATPPATAKEMREVDKTGFLSNKH